MGRGSGKKGKNLNELKQELEIDVHRVSVDELCKRFNSNVGEGLTDDQVAKGIAEHGLNQLTPPKTTPDWHDPGICRILCLLCDNVRKWLLAEHPARSAEAMGLPGCERLGRLLRARVDLC